MRVFFPLFLLLWSAPFALSAPVAEDSCPRPDASVIYNPMKSPLIQAIEGASAYIRHKFSDLCADLDRTQLRVGLSCKTSKGVRFELIKYGEGGAEVWRDTKSGLIWGDRPYMPDAHDRISGEFDQASAEKICASAFGVPRFRGNIDASRGDLKGAHWHLPSVGEFKEGADNGFFEVLQAFHAPENEKPILGYWSSTRAYNDSYFTLNASLKTKEPGDWANGVSAKFFGQTMQSNPAGVLCVGKE